MQKRRNSISDELELRIFWLDHFWPSNAIWRRRSWSILVQIIACCQTAPGRTWTNIDLSSMKSCGIHMKVISLEMLNMFFPDTYEIENYYFKITTASLWSQWVKPLRCCRFHMTSTKCSLCPRRQVVTVEEELDKKTAQDVALAIQHEFEATMSWTMTGMSVVRIFTAFLFLWVLARSGAL